jgi:putative ABC transport system permease protein
MQLPSNGVFDWAVQADQTSNTVGEYRLYELLTVALITLIVIIFVFLFLRSKTGLQLRAFGVHRRSGAVYAAKSPAAIYGGLFLSNALVGFSGAICAQANRLSSIEHGAGLLIPLLAAIVLGEFFVAELWERPAKKLFHRSGIIPPILSRPLALTLAPCVGFVIYQIFFILIAVVVLPDYTQFSMQSKYALTATMIIGILIYRRYTGRAGEPEDVV